MNSIVTLPIAAAIPTIAPTMPSHPSDDRLIAAAQAVFDTEAAIVRIYEDHEDGLGFEVDDLADAQALFAAQAQHLATVISVPARSAAGLKAKASVVKAEFLTERTNYAEIARSLADDVTSASPDVATPSVALDDAKAIDLGARFEQLFRRYLDERVKWAAAGKGSPECTAADDAMCGLSDEMRPLAEQIREIDATSFAQLRTVALKDLREKVPASRGQWELSDGCFGDLEMFWEVLRFVGLSSFAENIEDRLEQAVKSRRA